MHKSFSAPPYINVAPSKSFLVYGGLKRSMWWLKSEAPFPSLCGYFVATLSVSAGNNVSPGSNVSAGIAHLTPA